MSNTHFQNRMVATDRIIYTPSAFAKSSLVHLQEIGQLKAQSIHTSRRENLVSFLFFIVSDGHGTLVYNGESYELSKNSCVFIDCRKPYYHQTSPDLWTLKWVHFYGPNLNSIYDKYVERGGLPCFHPSHPENYHTLFHQIYNIAVSGEYIRDMKIYEKLTGLLTLLMSESWNPSKQGKISSKRRDLQSIKDYIDHNYTQKIALEDLAEKFFINKFYLTRIFREQFGITINNYLLQVRITHAKHLLRFTNDSIDKIGASCGMSDANYFARMFKKVEGISPGEFRKQW